MKVWVDLVNSPQVLVMEPIMRELRRRGHTVLVTSREYAQTTQLADRLGLAHVALGRHGGASRTRAVAYNLERAMLLTRVARKWRVDLALSHNSYSQGIAARMLRVPFVTMMDYEHHRANHLAFRLARRVLVPQVFPDAALRTFGASRRAVRYPGLKEELYLADFQPRVNFRSEVGLPMDRPVVVVRPPATWADYYHGRGRTFRALLEHLNAAPDAFVVYLPRVAAQAALIGALPADRVLVPKKALDGPNLLAHADVVVSGGGTMIREAAVLGTPAYSIFEGRLGAVDAHLTHEGRLRWIRSHADIAAIQIAQKPPVSRRVAWLGLVNYVTDAVLDAS